MYDINKECKEMRNRIKAICQMKDITYNALAKKACISNSTLSYILSGKSKPYVYTLLLLCNALEVSIHELLGEKVVYKTIAYESLEESINNQKERELLLHYRQLSNKKKELLYIYIDMLEQYKDKDLVEREILD